MNRDRTKTKLNNLFEKISSLERINADTKALKEVYCNSKTKVTDKTLINNEMYEEYKLELIRTEIEVDKAISSYSSILENTKSTFFDKMVGFFRNTYWIVLGKNC